MMEFLIFFIFLGLDVDLMDVQREGRVERFVGRQFSNFEEIIVVWIMMVEIWIGLMVRFWIYIESYIIRDLRMRK